MEKVINFLTNIPLMIYRYIKERRVNSTTTEISKAMLAYLLLAIKELLAIKININNNTVNIL